MIRFVAVRLSQALIALLAFSFAVFFLARVTGNPVDLLLPLEASPAEREALAKHMGLDKPMLYQYGVYLKNAFEGDFGQSLRTNRPVTELIVAPLVNSMRLASAAMVFTILVGIPLGVVAATHRGRFWDRLALTVAFLGQSLPSFWVGMILILMFAVMLRWLPTSGVGGWKHYILPAVTLGWFSAAGVMRLLRASMLEVLDAEYIKLARAKGVGERAVVWKHALSNALISVVTFIGLMYGILIAAAITVEVVFTWPGLGRLSYQALLWRDFPLLQFTLLIWASLIIGINFLVDIAYVVLDPRIRL